MKIVTTIRLITLSMVIALSCLTLHAQAQCTDILPDCSPSMCQAQPGYALSGCRSTCNNCNNTQCYDSILIPCQELAAAGYCATGVADILNYCPLSCGVCSASAPSSSEPSPAEPRNVTVCTAHTCDYSSLAEAVSDLAPGSIIRLKAGTYTAENIIIVHDLTIQGRGRGNTVIDGSDSARLFEIIGEDTIVTIKKVTLQHGHDTTPGGNQAGGGAIAVRSGTLHLERCSVMRNTSVHGHGGGVLYERGAQGSITNCRFGYNQTGGEGGAIAFTGVPAFAIDNVTFRSNVDTSGSNDIAVVPE